MTSSNTKLNILLNNTNKALAQVLLEATKDDLKDISKDAKDLRSIMDKVLKETNSGDSASNKLMLDLVKKNPTLNNLGSPSKTIKELINTIKSDKNPLPIEKVLKDVLIDIKNIKHTDIKPKLNNTGVFLESKIRNITNPQVELKNNLDNLKEILIKSPLPESQEILKKVEILLKDNILKTATNNDVAKEVKQNPKQLQNLSNEVKSLVNKLEKTIQAADPIHSSKTKEILLKLEFATNTTHTKIQLPSLKVKQDIPLNQDQPLKQNITKQELKLNLQTQATPTDVKEKVQVALSPKNIESLKIGSNNLDNVKPQATKEQVIQTTKIVDDATIKLPIVKETLKALQIVLDKSLTLESKTVLKSIATVIATLETSKEVSKDLKQDISKLIQDTKQIVQKGDIVYSKDLLTIFSKLKNLSSQNALNPQASVKEMLSNDLKATLLQTTSELQNSSNPNKNELIKQMDKLVLQIDNYQLISHLSNGTSVYLPITWDQLEGGELDIRKDSDKFYCDIELSLKDYGDISLKLTLFEKNQINIHLYSPNQELKELFQENLSILRAGMISAQIVPREIRFHDGVEKQESIPYQSPSDDFNIGFEVKG